MGRRLGGSERGRAHLLIGAAHQTSELALDGLINWSESRQADQWAYLNGVDLNFSRLGKPTDNAMTEAFNARLRAERLNENWFLSLADAREKIEEWRRYYY